MYIEYRIKWHIGSLKVVFNQNCPKMLPSSVFSGFSASLLLFGKDSKSWISALRWIDTKVKSQVTLR